MSNRYIGGVKLLLICFNFFKHVLHVVSIYYTRLSKYVIFCARVCHVTHHVRGRRVGVQHTQGGDGQQGAAAVRVHHECLCPDLPLVPPRLTVVARTCKHEGEGAKS